MHQRLLNPPTPASPHLSAPVSPLMSMMIPFHLDFIQLFGIDEWLSSSLFFENSVIHYQHKYYYHQETCTAMGVFISVYFANTFMFSLTWQYIERPPAFIINWTRFVIEIFLLITGTPYSFCCLVLVACAENLPWSELDYQTICEMCRPDLNRDPTNRRRFVGVITLNPLCNGLRSARRHHRILRKYFKFILINF